MVHGVAMPATSGVPYAPIAAALEHLLEPVSDEMLAALAGPTGDVIARLVPIIRPRLAALGLLPHRPRIVATEWREARMFEAVLWLLERLGDGHGLLAGHRVEHEQHVQRLGGVADGDELAACR